MIAPGYNYWIKDVADPGTDSKLFLLLCAPKKNMHSPTLIGIFFEKDTAVVIATLLILSPANRGSDNS